MIKSDIDLRGAIKQARKDAASPTTQLQISSLITPLVTHGLLLLLYLGGGYWVFKTFNESAWGFVGVAMMLWGGLFHGMILLFIYGFAGYAALFRPDWFQRVLERRHIERVNGRIEKDLLNGDVDKALDRLRGLLSIYRENFTLRRRLAALLIEQDQLAAAGQLIILHPRPTPPEQKAILAFKEANGNDAFQFLRKTIKGVSGQNLSKKSRLILEELHRQIDDEQGQASWQYRLVQQYLDYTLRRPYWQVIWAEHRNVLIELMIALSLLSFFWFIQ